MTASAEAPLGMRTEETYRPSSPHHAIPSGSLMVYAHEDHHTDLVKIDVSRDYEEENQSVETDFVLTPAEAIQLAANLVVAASQCHGFPVYTEIPSAARTSHFEEDPS